MSDLLKQLSELSQNLDQDIKSKYQRSLPFYENLSDRWERAKDLNFGEQASIYQASYVYGDVKVGKDTWIGPFTIIDGSGGLEIGRNCSISSGVQIYSHDSIMRRISDGKVPITKAPTKIGNCCYIGPMAIISKGVEIGDHYIVAAQSLVNKSFPAYSVIAGTPAKLKGTIEFENDEPKIKWIKDE